MNSKIVNIRFSLDGNGHGQLRLWCELDESFDCYHIGYAMTLAPVQDMFARVRGGK